MPALYVNLMPKYQDLGYQRSSRPEQPDQRRPNKAALQKGPHVRRHHWPIDPLFFFRRETSEP
jgi:hypothetical protein